MSYIVKHLAQDCVEFLPVIIPPLMILIKSNDQDLIFDLYQCLYAIIASVPASINKFSDIIFETINEVIVTQSIQVLELIKLLNINCKEMLTTDMFLLLPKVLQLVEYKRAHDVQVAIKAVNTIGDFHISILSNYLYIIIPMLLRICSNGVSAEEIKLNIEVLKTIDTKYGVLNKLGEIDKTYSVKAKATNIAEKVTTYAQEVDKTYHLKERFDKVTAWVLSY